MNDTVLQFDSDLHRGKDFEVSTIKFFGVGLGPIPYRLLIY